MQISKTSKVSGTKEISRTKGTTETKGATEIIYCKYCNSTHVIKRGINYNKQQYQCKDCKRYFRIGDNRIKRDIREKELALLLYSHNTSIRSIQSVLNKYFNTNIAFNVIDNWIKSPYNLLNYDIKRLDKKEKLKTIEVLELDELYSYFYDFKKTTRKCQTMDCC